MKKSVIQQPPVWLFTLLEIGAFIACGIYIGLTKAEGPTTGNIIRIIGFGLLGLAMLWGVLNRK
jgi:hypothetical protein